MRQIYKIIFTLVIAVFCLISPAAIAIADTTIYEIEKQPAEYYPIAFEYFNKLPKGVSLVSGTISAHNITDNVDATATILQSTTATITGTQALVKIRAGTTGKRYQITLRVTCSNSYILEDELYLSVREL
jgi:hypothetical protein